MHDPFHVRPSAVVNRYDHSPSPRLNEGEVPAGDRCATVTVAISFLVFDGPPLS